MSQERISRPGGGDDDSAEEFGSSAGQMQINTQGVDDLLDDIDSVLESNAEDFVKNFVQKGGQ